MPTTPTTAETDRGRPWPDYVLATAALAAIVLALSIIVAWHGGDRQIADWCPHYPTAIAVCLAGMGLWAGYRGRSLCMGVFGFAVLISGLCPLISRTFGFTCPLDTLLQPLVSSQLPWAGPMTIGTAACFVAVGAVLLGLSFADRFLSLVTLYAALGTLVTATGLVVIFGLGLELGLSSHWPAIAPATPQSAAFLVVLGTGTVLLAWRTATPDYTLPRWLPIPAAMIVFTLTAVLWQALVHNEATDVVHETEEALARVQRCATALANREQSILRQMAERYASSPPMGLDDWAADARLTTEKNPIYQAIEWVTPSGHVQRVVPIEGNEEAAGLDLGFEHRRRTAMATAEATGRPTFSEAVDLVQGQKGVLLFAPMADADEFHGFILGVYRLSHLFDAVLADVAPGYAAQLLGPAHELLYSQGVANGTLTDSYNVQEGVVRLGNLKWTVQLSALPKSLATRGARLANAVLVMGLIVGLLLGFAVRWAGQSRRTALSLAANQSRLQLEIAERASVQNELRSAHSLLERRVERRTQALRETNTALNDQMARTAQSEALFRTLLDSAPYAIIMADSKGVIRRVNRETDKVFGYEPNELVGQPIETLVPKRFRQAHPAKRAAFHALPIEQRTRHPRDVVGVTKAGTEFAAEIALRTVTVDREELVLCAASNVTERKDAEALLHQLTESLQQANAKLDRLSTVDPLTSALNRRGLDAVLRTELARAKRMDVTVAALLIDCDDFKLVNDVHGHAVGDQVLAAISQRAAVSLRGTDYLSRVGGDEFVALLPDCTDAQAHCIAERIRLGVSSLPIKVAGSPLHLTVSIGLALLPPETRTVDHVIALTQLALRKAKHAGKNQVASPSTEAIPTAATAQAELADIISGKELHVMVQPIVNVNDGQWVGYEMFVRGPVGALQTPLALLDAATQHQLSAPIDICCLQSCVKSAESLQAAGRIHINLLPSTLYTSSAQLAQVFATTNPGQDYCVELSEASFAGSSTNLTSALATLRQHNVAIAIDHVGAGSGTVDLLLHMEPDFIKLAPTVTHGIHAAQHKQALLKRIISVARALGAKTIATGIESHEDAALLRQHGVDLAQGYLWSKPQPAKELCALAAAHQGQLA